MRLQVTMLNVSQVSELLEKNGMYAALYRMQFEDDATPKLA